MSLLVEKVLAAACLTLKISSSLSLVKLFRET